MIAKLSKQQTILIGHIAAGCRVKEAADAMRISERTAQEYLIKVRLKLQARTLSHAVAIWVRR